MESLEPTTLETPLPFLARLVGVLGWLSFYLSCMILSFVGPTGSRVAWAARNKITFLAVAFSGVVFSGLAIWTRRAASRKPRAHYALFGLCAFLFLGALFNAFSI